MATPEVVDAAAPPVVLMLQRLHWCIGTLIDH